MLVGDLQKLLQSASGGFAPEMFSKARHAAAACAAGVQRVHIINGREDEGLLAEVFSNEGIGTLIYANEYEQIRPAKKKDIRAIQIADQEGSGSRRTRPANARRDGKEPVRLLHLRNRQESGGVRGATRLCRQQQGELASLYVDPSHENQGIGRKLIHFVEDKARELGSPN